MIAGRPQPPAEVLDPLGPSFVPSQHLAEWAQQSFIAESATLLNEEHTHLREAIIGFLWTGIPNSRQMRTVVGTAEPGRPRATMGKWPKARAEMQIAGWFGEIPDFLITLDARYAEQCDDASFCALLEHELYHCGQERDEFGGPKFTADGRPKFGMRGHDVEEFVGIVRRYGVGAAAGETFALVEAAKRGPEIARAGIAGVCGTCAASLRMA